MDIGQTQFLQTVIKQATISGHIWPVMAACEAALETRFGKSQLAIQGNNLFGMKQHKIPIFETISIPTREYIDGKYTQVSADWIKYPTIGDCIVDRMNTLKRLPMYYGPALSATNPIDYVTEVSKAWSSDPKRASSVISIYEQYTNGVQSQ